MGQTILNVLFWFFLVCWVLLIIAWLWIKFVIPLWWKWEDHQWDKFTKEAEAHRKQREEWHKTHQ